MQETHVRSLGWEDPLEKGIVTHSSILAWRILWTEELGRLQSMELQTVRHDWANMYLYIYIYIYTYRVFLVAWGIESTCNAGDARDACSIPGLEDPLEKELSTHSSIPAWKTPWTEEPVRLQSMQLQRVDYTHMHIYVYKYKWTYICLFTSLFIFFTKIEVPWNHFYLSCSPLNFWHLLQCLVHGWPSLNVADGKKKIIKHL